MSNVSAMLLAQAEREWEALRAADRARKAAEEQKAAEEREAAEEQKAKEDRRPPDSSAADASPAAPASGKATSRDDRSASSVVFTVRLDPAELEALRQRAQDRGLQPSVLARNLIRIGLQPAARPDDLARAVDRLEEAVTAFRAIRPAH